MAPSIHKDGSFGTNFVEVAYHRFSTQAAFPFTIPWIGMRVPLPAWKRVAFEQHITPWRVENLKDLYETSKIKAEFRTIGRSLGSPKNPWLFKFYVSGSYVLSGKKYILADERHPDTRKEAGILDKMHLTTTLQMRPPKVWIFTWENINLFAKFDLGYDYYNIHFAEQIARFQFGFAGDRFLD